MHFEYIFSLFYLILIIESHQSCVPYQKKLNNSNELISSFSNASGVISKTFVKDSNGILIYGRVVIVNNPLSTISVLQPNNDNQGCKKHETYRTTETAIKAGNCEVAINAGFFNTQTKECIGNLINDGILYRNSGGIRNANFGIKKDGKLFFGYLSSEEVNSSDFNVLVGGVIWLVRNGSSVVEESIATECNKSQETGSLNNFANVVSARTAVGAFINGSLVLVHVEGKTVKGGINLFDFAKLLQQMEVVSAINLDGGGSATMVINRTLVSYPSDACSFFTCERPVSTVLCVRAQCPSQCPPLTHCVYGFCEPMSNRNPFSVFMYVSIALLVVGVLILLINVLFAVRWIVRQRNQSKISKWARNEDRLVLYENDDFVHFDSQPLMNDIDYIQEL